MQRFDGKGFYQIDENATTLKYKKNYWKNLIRSNEKIEDNDYS